VRPGRQGLRQRQNEFTSIAPWSTASHINRRQLENSCLTKYRGFRSVYFLFIWRFKAADWTADCASDRDNEHRINSSPERSTCCLGGYASPPCRAFHKAVRPLPGAGGHPAFCLPMCTTPKTSGLPWLGMSDRAEISNCSRPAEAWPRGSTVDLAGAGFVCGGFPDCSRRNSRLCHAAISNPFSNKSPAPITSARCTTSAPCTEIPAAVQILPGN